MQGILNGHPGRITSDFAALDRAADYDGFVDPPAHDAQRIVGERPSPEEIAVAVSGGLMTVNEARGHFGLPPLPGEDRAEKFWRPLTVNGMRGCLGLPPFKAGGGVPLARVRHEQIVGDEPAEVKNRLFGPDAYPGSIRERAERIAACGSEEAGLAAEAAGFVAPPAGLAAFDAAVPAPPDDAPPLRLNIGAGGVHLAGFTAIDRDSGGEAWPLDVPDESAEEILASHVLEHFSHRDTGNVLKHWVDKLKPGGRIRIAVPDFEDVASRYLKGEPVNVQGYVMGGHTDRDDRHGCLFDREALAELMVKVGLERIGPWQGEPGTCSAGPHSLNLQGFKPSGPTTSLEGIVRACMSVPRFGPLMHPRCAEKAFHRLRIQARAGQSCFWHQKLSELMEDAIADPACRYVLTMDFDTVFGADDVLELFRLLEARPDVAAVFPLQAKRGCEQALFSLAGKKPGTVKASVAQSDLARNLLPAHTGHFGLTLIRADVLRSLPRPWMQPTPNAQGRWEGGQTDADIAFWHVLRQAGHTACLAPRVVVGHLEEVVKWPGKDLVHVCQPTSDYEENGIPASVMR